MENDELIYGLKGVMDLFRIGHTKASHLNSSGALDEAKILSGRKLVFSKNKLLNLKLK